MRTILSGRIQVAAKTIQRINA